MGPRSRALRVALDPMPGRGHPMRDGRERRPPHLHPGHRRHRPLHRRRGRGLQRRGERLRAQQRKGPVTASPDPEPTPEATIDATRDQAAGPTQQPIGAAAPALGPWTLAPMPIAPLPPRIRVTGTSMRAVLRRGAHVEVTSRAGGRFRIELTAQGRRQALAREAMQVSPGVDATIRLRPTAPARAWLRRTGRRHISVVVSRLPGGSRVASARVLLRRRG